MKSILFALTLSAGAVTLEAGFSREKVVEVPGFRLQLNEETYLTDKMGVALPEQIINAPLGKLVKIYRTDGFCYEGTVTEIVEEAGLYKMYGKMNNIASARFGFVLAQGGKFAGAVLDDTNNEVYSLEFSKEHKGFVLKRNFKYDKVTS
jgi:hypothetical protein